MSKLKSFLYILLRDHVPFGDVEGIIRKHVEIAETQVTFEGVELSAYADSLVRRLSPPPSCLPKDGDTITIAGAVAVAKEGCRQALGEALPSPPTAGKGDRQPIHHPHRTVIAALPPGRRKYVKLFLKSLGFCNLDQIPTTLEQKPYDLGRNFLSVANLEKLISLAPNIVLRDVL